MGKLNLEYYKKNLEEEKTLLEGQLSELGVVDPKSNDWGAILPGKDDQADPSIAADRLEDFGERSATLGELEIRYKSILEALKKIEIGGYGVCKICKEIIETKRLEANPSSNTCIKHKEE